MSLTVCWPSEGGTKEVSIPLPVASATALYTQVARAFGAALPRGDFSLTDTTKDAIDDDDVASLRDGALLVLTFQEDGALAAPAREKITFQPHPKTLTMAGDYEYFAAQGRHPFVYALAEFVDNSLRATRKNAPRPRNITVSVVLSGSGGNMRGLVCVTDNGCGMTKHELNDWAVMNYSMEERGTKPQEPEAAGRGNSGSVAGRFLNGDLSFFGVGSKNAAFFMGSSIKVVTRKAGERYVHELCLAAADLEARYRNQEAVYEEDMVHRNPGDASTLGSIEQPFGIAREWVRAEAESGPQGTEAFTRVIIGDLKPDVLLQLAQDEAGTHTCSELAHLYHYYLHGEGGNRVAGGTAVGGLLPNGDPLPDIVLQRMTDTSLVWRRRLMEVEDDMETRMLRAQRAELPFTLQVADKGTVSGVLYYFPFENDRETAPLENPLSCTKPAPSPFAHGPATAQPGLTQTAGGRTQGGAGATQFGARTTQAVGCADGDASDEEEGAAVRQTPIFEAFWQGRLIPGARIETLPFIEAVRQRRTAQAKDNVPDEAFGRLRGALFFGPAFRVTRNKLLFRDNLQEVLAAAVPGDRHMEKRFKEWVSRCHATLDKSVRFEALADSRTQASLRSKLGEATTAFERVSDGQRAVSAGDVVRINAKPAVVGRVTFFTIPQAVREEGAYANGRIHVEPLPAEVHGAGPAAMRLFSLRRVEGVLCDKEVSDHTQREVARLPAALRVEPMRFATGQPLEFAAGDAVPETTVVVMSGGGQRLVRAFYGGEKQAITVTQRLWWLPAEGALLPGDGGQVAEQGAELAERPSKRPRKGRKGKKPDENDAPDVGADAAAGDGVCGSKAVGAVAAELILSVENKTPNKEAFQFARLCDGLRKAGHYALEYSGNPAVPGQALLRLVVPLVVSAGAPASLDVSGEGRAAAALRELALGESLPPLKVMLSDSFGNPVPLAPGTATGIRIFAALRAPDGDAPVERCKELTVASEQELADDCIMVNALRVLGSKKAVLAGAGLSMLLPAAVATNASGAGAQRTISQQALPAAELQLCFLLQGSSGELEPHRLPLRVHAGAPQALKLLPGSPWTDSSTVVTVGSGEELPPLAVQAVDAWGNPTAPSDDLPFTITADSSVLAPQSWEFRVDTLGVAHVSGLQATSSTKGADWSTLNLRIDCAATTPAAETALAAAQPAKELELRVLVEPSALPASALILMAGEPLPMREATGEDGSLNVALIEGVEAGSALRGLSLMLLDEAGNPATMSIAGKVTVSWHRGMRKTNWSGEPFKLPVLQAPHSVAEVADLWVRFQGDSSNPVTIEAGLEVRAAPAAPANWAVSLLDQATSQCADELGVVQCGRPFALEIEALDKFNNRCGGDGEGKLPEPEIVLEAEGPLQYDTAQWDRGWVAHGRDQVYSARLVMGGHPGQVKIFARDAAGEGGASALAEDCLTVELRAGPPAALAFTGPAALELGSKACLSSLEICVHDAAGNPSAASEAFEVMLCASALSVDGSGRAAKISVAGSNKVKVAKGRTSATFKNVSLAAEAPGTYALRVQSASRKVALTEGVLRVTMALQNVVSELRVGVPEDMAEGCPAGRAGRLLVAVETENRETLPEDAAAAGLTLRITPPGGSKADAMLCSLPTLDEGQLAMEEAAYVFALAELTAAGTYSAVAEYSEQRPEVRAGLSKKEADLRSSTVQFEVLPGPPVVLSVEAPSVPDRLAVTNGPSAKQRLLVRNAAVQLRDEYANAAEAAAVQVRFRLLASRGHGTKGAQWAVPELHVAEGSVQTPVETDDRGRCFLGNLSVVEGSGRAASGTLECELLCEALGLYPSSSHELELDEEGWAVCWRCPVLFSDDSARFAAVEALNEQRAELAVRRAELAGRVEAVQGAVAQALREQARVGKQAAAKQKVLGGDAPQTAEAAERRACELQRAGAEAAEIAVRQAKYGSPSNATTSAVDMVLRSGDEAVVGAMAQLVTIDDERLARVASCAMRAMLAVVIVTDAECRTRLGAMLAQKKYPMPDVLALTHVNQYRGQKQGEIPAFRSAGELAQRLVRAACAGTDRPLPLPLPHQKAGGGCKDCALGPNDWPAGCLGYLFNLVRPVHKGHRTTVVYGMLSGILVFESMEHAAAYREIVTQRMRHNCPDILTLDMGRISARGIMSGSSFRPPPLDKTDYVVGSNPAGVSGSGVNAAQQAEAMQEWAELLRARDGAAAAAEAAKAEAAGEEQRCQGKLEEVERQLADVDAQLGQGSSPAAADGGSKAALTATAKQRSRQEQQHEATAGDVAGEGADEEPTKGKPKRRRLAKMR